MSLGWSRFWKRNKDRCSLGAAVVLSFLFMALDQSSPLVSLKKGTARSVGMFQEWVSWIPRLKHVREENRRLSVELAGLSLERDRCREALIENRRLRRLLEFKEQSAYDFIPAEVIGRGTVGVPGSVHLNMGWDEGCRKDMALVTDRGVVGKLLFVNASMSVGQLLTDPNFRISAKVQESGVMGIVRWLYGNVCSLDGVPLNSDVQVGNRVVTSGYSQIYPEGFFIGRIFDVSSDQEGLFKNVLLRTAVDFETLEELLVLRSIPSF